MCHGMLLDDRSRRNATRFLCRYHHLCNLEGIGQTFFGGLIGFFTIAVLRIAKYTYAEKQE